MKNIVDAVYFFLILSFGLIISTHSEFGRAEGAGGISKTKSTGTQLVQLPQSGPLFTVRKVEVSGLKKIEREVVLQKIKSQKDQSYSENQIKEDILALFKLGYFYNIKVDRLTEGSQIDLTFHLVEKPTIVDIKFEGNLDLKTEELLEASGLKTYEILDMSKLKTAQDKIQKFYEDKGFFLAKIETAVEDEKKDETVKVLFKLKENDKVKVKQITILGNRKLSDNFIKDRLVTTEGGFFSFLSNSGAYKQEAFDRDIMLIKILYSNEGYINVKVDRPQVYVTPDKKTIYITLRIDEGEQYEVGEIDFSGDLLFTREELNEGLQLNKKKIFVWEALQKDLSDLQAKYGDLGYAFTNVIPKMKQHDKERKVDITFEFDKGSKVYFGKINIVGNTKTRDKVVRRELSILEGELYNETKKRESIENVKRPGYFEDVSFRTSTPPEKPNILNVDIVVKERNTGSIQFGAGYGSIGGFTVTGQVSQSNFLGKGQKLSAGLNLSKDGDYYNFSFTEPYFLDSKWSLGFDLYKERSSRSEYSEEKLGASFRLGYPFAEYWNGSLRYKVENAKLYKIYDYKNNLLTDEELYPLSSVSGQSSGIMGILEYDRRDDRFSPTKGINSFLTLELAGIGGNVQYWKGNTTFRFYKNIIWDLVWRNNISYSMMNTINPNDTPPFNQLYLLGGPYTLRGYGSGRVGRTRFSQLVYNNLTPPIGTRTPAQALMLAQRPYGGKTQFLYQTEFEFPLITEVKIKGVTFFDIGQAEDQITNERFYSDVGFGFRWLSPVGPLRFEWGFPLRYTDNSPDGMVFDFSIGGPF